MSPDGRRVLTASYLGSAKLWDAETGQELRSFAGDSGGVGGVAFSPDGRRVLTGGRDRMGRLWDADTGLELRTFAGHSSTVSSVAFSSDGRRVLTGSVDNTAKLWDAETGKALLTFAGHVNSVFSVAFSADGRRVLTGSLDRTAKLWDAGTGREVRTFEGHSGGVGSVAFSPNGRQALTGSYDKTAKLWDAETGKVLRTLFAGQMEKVSSVAFSPDGRRVLAASRGTTAKLWDAETGTEGRTFAGHSSFVGSVAFSPDGRRVLTGGYDGTAKLWDAETGRELRTFAGQADSVSSVAFSPNGRRVVTASEVLAGSEGAAAYLWNAETGRGLATLAGHARALRSVAFSPDGRRVLTGSLDNTARLWDAETGRQLLVFAGHSGGIGSVAFSPDGRRVLTGGYDGAAKLWDAETGREVRTFAGHSSLVRSVAFSPDGRRVLTGSDDHTAKIWEAQTGQELQTLAGHATPLDSVAFSPDGRRVLTGSRDRTARLWDADTGRALLTFAGHVGSVFSVAFSPDERRVLTGSEDRTAKIWDAQTGQALRTFAGHSGLVSTVAFSPDGRRVLTGSWDLTAKLWDAEAGRCLATLVSFRNGTWAVVDPSGRYDASNGGDVAGLHWVVGNTLIALSQLKERYYEPGLLAKAMGFSKEPLRLVESFAAPKLFPEVVVSSPSPGDTKLRIGLKNQGGGIGKVRVLVNGKEIAADARGPNPEPNAPEASLTVDIAGATVRPGQKNEVEVIAWNAEGYLSSRGAALEWRAPGAKNVEPPEVFAIVCGTTRYASPSMNLTFAGKDAADMASAIRVSARRLFGAKRVHLTLLTDHPGAEGSGAPSRENLRQAFEAARMAKPDDILVVYLSGHGTTAPDGEYWYLTREARSTDLSDPQVRAASGVSSSELTEWVKAVPTTKQVMILDTCAAGAAAAKLSEPRALSSDQVRAIERLKDRTGLYVLMGAAADAVSYEASRYGQGLLTYTLLQGMRGAALRDDEYVDVARLFGHAADEVPRLATSVGGIQRPVISAPKGTSFDIGQLKSEDKPLVPLALVRPMILRASFQIQKPPFSDSLGLSRRVDAELREASEPVGRGRKIVFVDADELPGAFRLAGRYRRENDRIRIEVYLLEGEEERGHFEVSGPGSDPEGLARDVVTKAEEALVGKR